MRMRRLGRSGLEVPEISFGAWTIGGWCWGGCEEEGAVRAIQEGIEAGMCAVDTAPMYGFGRSERIVGRAVRGRAEEVVLMTKAGLRWDDPAGEPFFETEGEDGRKVSVHRNARPESLRVEVDRSLERLGVERIDLLQIHWPDPTTPVAETMGGLLELRAEGKVREIGVSNYTVPMMVEAQAALGEVPLASDQPPYNLVRRGIERDVLPFAREREVGILAYSPLEQGLLTGEVPAGRTFSPGDERGRRGTFQPRSRAAVNDALERVVRPLAELRDATLAQVVLAWTAAQPGVTSVLAGARSPEQARENAAAGALELSTGELRTIGAIFAELRLGEGLASRLRARLGRALGRLRGGG